MGDPYPYNYSSYKRKPMDAFLQGFLESMNKVLMYKMQKRDEEDSATKRQKMEQDWYTEKERLKAAADASDPYRQGQIENQRLGNEKLRREMDAPEKKSTLEQYFGSLGLGGGAMPPVEGGAAPGGMFGDLAATIGKEPGQGGLEVGQARALRELFGAEKGVGPALAAEMVPTQESEAEAVAAADQAKMDADADAEKDTWSTLIKAGRAGSNEEADALLTQKKADALLGSKPSNLVEDALEKRKAEIAVLAADHGEEKAKELYAKKTLEDYQKAIPAELPNEIAEQLGEIAAYGIPIPPSPGMGMGAAGLSSRVKFYTKFIESVNKGGGPAEFGIARAEYRAGSSALLKNEQMYSVTNTFIRTIDENNKTIRRIKKEHPLEFGKMVNSAWNLVRTKTKGSGDLEALRLALMSTSKELAKVEEGSLGIAAASVFSQEQMDKIHNMNLDEKDIFTVLDMSEELGRNRRKAYAQERKAISNRMVGRDEEEDELLGNDDVKPKGKYDGKKMFGVKGQAAPEPAAQAQQTGPKGEPVVMKMTPDGPKRGYISNGRFIVVSE